MLPSFTFTTFPFEFAKLQSMTPLGNLNPPAHTFPTDHIYLFHHVGREADAPYDVVAPADGTVVMVQREADDAVYIASSSVHTYFIGHMLVRAFYPTSTSRRANDSAPLGPSRTRSISAYSTPHSRTPSSSRTATE